MAIDLGTAYLSIAASTRGLKPAIEKELGGIGKGSGAAGGESYGRSFAQKAKGVMGTIFQGVGLGIGIKLADGITGAVSGAFRGGFDRLMNIEQANIKFKTLGIDAKAAMASVDEAVTDTKFAISDAADMASFLGASGVETGKDMTKWLSRTADAAQFTNRDFGSMQQVLQKVVAEGRVTGDTFQQLPLAAAALSDHLKISQEEVRALASKGKISAEELGEALDKKIGGAAKDSGASFLSMRDNIFTALNASAAALLESITDAAMPILASGLDLMKGFRDNVAKPIGAAMSDFLQPKAEAFAKVLEGLPATFSAIKALVTDGEFTDGLFGIKEDSPAATGILNIRTRIEELNGLVQGSASILFDGKFAGQGIMGIKEDHPLVGALSTIRDRFIALGDWITGVGMPAFQKVGDSLATNLLPILQMLGTYVTDLIIPVFGEAGRILLSVLGPAFETVTRIVSNTILPILGAVAEFIGDKVIPAVKRFADDVLLPAFGKVAGFITTEFLPVFETVMEFIRDEIAPVVLDFADRVLIPAFERIGAIAGWLFDNVLFPSFEVLWQTLKEVIGPAVAWLWREVFAPTFTGIGDLVDDFGGRWANMWNGIKAAAAQPVNFVIETVWNNGLMKVLNMLPGVDLAPVSPVSWGSSRAPSRNGGGGPKLSAHQDGGYINLPWSAQNRDPYIGAIGGVPAFRFEGEEFITKRDSVAAMNRKHPGALDYINEHGTLPVPGLARGGRVHPISSGVGTTYAGHTGRDFGAPRGTPVMAAGDGIITAVRHMTTSYGKHIRQRLDEGFGAVYAHLSSIGVSPGQRVSAGQRIGGVGNTGNSFGNHLHFGINESPAATVAFLRGAGVSKMGAAGSTGAGMSAVMAPVETMSTLGIPKMIAEVMSKMQAQMTSPWGVMIKDAVISKLGDLKNVLLDKPIELAKGLFDRIVGGNKKKDNVKGVGGYRDGTASARRGPAIVGENGPEIVDFDGGERVRNSSRTAEQRKSGGGDVNIDKLILQANVRDWADINDFLASIRDQARIELQLDPEYV